MKRNILILIAAAALVLGAGPAFAATPATVAVSPSATTDSWSGASFLLGATTSPTACPASLDLTNTLCDHVSLDVGASSSYWDTHTGGIQVTITWPDSSDNFDLYVFKGGTQVASSAHTGTASETVSLSNAAGSYEIRIVPTLVTSSGYSGKVSFSSQAIPTPPPTSTGSGGSGSGSGSGTGGTSGGSTSGSGSTGSTTGAGASGPTGPGGLQAPVANYAFSGYGASSPGSLFYAPYPGSSGGGTTYFGDGQGASRKVVYASAYGGQVSGAVADQVAAVPTGRPIVSTIARTTWLLWLLLSLGVILLALVTYVIVEPEGDTDRTVRLGRTRARLPIPPLALAGGLVRGLAAGGRVIARLARTVTVRRQRTT